MADTDPRVLTAKHVALMNSGFQPRRHARLVRLARRVLWPLIRPFHFYMFDRLLELESRLPEVSVIELGAVRQMAADSATSVYELRHSVARAAEEIAALRRVVATTDDMKRLIFDHVALRGDVVALTNRHLWGETALEDAQAAIASFVTTLDALRGQVARLAATSDAVVGSVTGLHDMAGRLREATLDAQQRLARAEAAEGELAATLTLFVGRTNDGVFVLKRGDLISEMATRHGKWDGHVLEVADEARRSRRGGAVDVGAHFGLLSVPLARRFDWVRSFEPNGFNASLLRANAVLNGHSNITCYEEALFSHEARVSLAPDDKQEIPVPLTEEGELDIRAAANLGAYSFHPGEAGLYPRDARALDSFNLQDLAFLKIDTQGADGEVLMGAMQTIARCRPWVVFEWEEHLSAGFSVSFAEIEARFADLGYELDVLWRHNDKQIDYLAKPVDAASWRAG